VNKQETLDDVAAFCRRRVESATTDDKRVLIIQVGTIAAEYVRRYWDDDVDRYQTLDVEGEVVCDVVNPATGRASTIFDHASKLDGLAFDRYNREKVIIEHKSTGAGLDPASAYWRRLTIDGQVSKYLLALRQTGHDAIRSVCYDVVRKPTTNPKRISAAAAREIATNGRYAGFDVSESCHGFVRDAYERDQTVNAGPGSRGGFKGKLTENLELYGLRLRRLIADDSGAWFARRTITRTDDELEEYARELWALARELRESRAAGVWPKNSQHCAAYGRTCEYLPVCCSERSVTDDAFASVDFVHSELSTDVATSAPRGGRDLLTNSRLATLQSCKRRHYLRYELGVRPAAESDSVALFWGSLYHELMEIVWNAYKGDGIDGDN